MEKRQKQDGLKYVENQHTEDTLKSIARLLDKKLDHIYQNAFEKSVEEKVDR